LEQSHKLVEEASVTAIRDIKPFSPGIKNIPNQQPSTIYLNASVEEQEASQLHQNLDICTPQRHHLGILYREITSARNFSAAAAAERWQEIKNSAPSGCTTIFHPCSDDGNAGPDEDDPLHKDLVPVDRKYSESTEDSGSHAEEENSSAASVACTDTSLSSCDCDTPSKLTVGKHRNRSPGIAHRRPKLPSSLFQDENKDDLITRLRLGLPLPAIEVSPKTVKDDKPSPRPGAKKPWLSPALSDFTIKENPLGSPTPQQLPTRAAKRVRDISLQTPVKGKVYISPNHKTIGSTNRRQYQNPGMTMSNGRKVVNPYKERSGPESRSTSTPSKTSSTQSNTDSAGCSAGCSSKPVLTELTNSQRIPSEEILPDVPECYGLGEFDRRCQAPITPDPLPASPASPATPPTSERPWVRHSSSSDEYSRLFPPSILGDARAPSWSIEGGELLVKFADESLTGTYEIDVQVKVFVNRPKFSQCLKVFYIPGLLKAEGSTITGSFAFFLDPAKSLPKTFGMRFYPEGLLDCRIKETSHVIGRFHLAAPPSLSIRMKQEFHLIKHFDAHSVIHTNVRPVAGSGGILDYDVKMICEIGTLDIYANRVGLCVVIKHEHPSLKRHRCSIDAKALSDISSLISKNEMPMILDRDIQDSSQSSTYSIDLRFSVSCTFGQKAFPHLTIRPLLGKVLSEKIILKCLELPLLLEHIQRKQFSTWTAEECKEDGHRTIQLTQQEMPKNYPEGLKDDPLIRISELERIAFSSFETSDKPMMVGSMHSVVSGLQLMLYPILGNTHIGFEIILSVEVGKEPEVLHIDPKGWDPCHSFINGQLASKQQGQWRKTKDGHLTIFKNDALSPGTMMHIIIVFQHIKSDCLKDTKTLCSRVIKTYALPKIIGKTILGATLTSELDDCKSFSPPPPLFPQITFPNPPTGTICITPTSSFSHESLSLTQSLSLNSRKTIYTPTLTPSYQLSLGLLPTSPKSVSLPYRCRSLSPSKQPRQSSSFTEIFDIPKPPPGLHPRSLNSSSPPKITLTPPSSLKYSTYPASKSKNEGTSTPASPTKTVRFKDVPAATNALGVSAPSEPKGPSPSPTTSSPRHLGPGKLVIAFAVVLATLSMFIWPPPLIPTNQGHEIAMSKAGGLGGLGPWDAQIGDVEAPQGVQVGELAMEEGMEEAKVEWTAWDEAISRREQAGKSKAEEVKVIDWIDKALGWKGR
jgi:hypothetical protein